MKTYNDCLYVFGAICAVVIFAFLFNFWAPLSGVELFWLVICVAALFLAIKASYLMKKEEKTKPKIIIPDFYVFKRVFSASSVSFGIAREDKSEIGFGNCFLAALSGHKIDSLAGIAKHLSALCDSEPEFKYKLNVEFKPPCDSEFQYDGNLLGGFITHLRLPLTDKEKMEFLDCFNKLREEAEKSNEKKKKKR